MKRFVYFLDDRINLITVLFLFWSLYWGLNGLDKFFNGKSELLLDGWATQATIVDLKEDGAPNKPVYKIQPSTKIGWFGVNRDDKMAMYFRTLHMPRWVAIGSLYFFAVAEIILGAMFLALFFWGLRTEEKRETVKNMFSDRTVHRLAFKGSVLIFVAFSTGDILFGDRMELWEHGTFLVMTLVTYDMWYKSDQFFLDLRRKRLQGIDDDDDTNSRQASSYNLKTDKE
ncbi:MAG: hypothetical protein OEM82_07925 [Acidobacteriota bacterium]|nr:hypothetical protein [Acidobacteriota bacterium]MDH3529948.1 hypothetical protein [Acidobacteriota bacterium]